MDENKQAIPQLTSYVKNVVPQKLIPAAATAVGGPIAGVVAANALNLGQRIQADRQREQMMQQDQYQAFSDKIQKCLKRLNFNDYNQPPEAMAAFKNLTIWKNKLEQAKYNLKLAKANNNPVTMQSAQSQIDQAKLNIAKYQEQYNQSKSR